MPSSPPPPTSGSVAGAPVSSVNSCVAVSDIVGEAGAASVGGVAGGDGGGIAMDSGLGAGLRLGWSSGDEFGVGYAVVTMVCGKRDTQVSANSNMQ